MPSRLPVVIVARFKLPGGPLLPVLVIVGTCEVEYSLLDIVRERCERDWYACAAVGGRDAFGPTPSISVVGKVCRSMGLAGKVSWTAYIATCEGLKV